MSAYDKIGNRTTETRDGGSLDTYQYLTNGGGGNTPILAVVNLGVGGTRDFTYGLAGHLEHVAARASIIDFGSQGLLHALRRKGGPALTPKSYSSTSTSTAAPWPK